MLKVMLASGLRNCHMVDVCFGRLPSDGSAAGIAYWVLRVVGV
jgi:hypothetical protein